MGNEISKKPKLKDILYYINCGVGTFLFVFFLMSAIIIFTTNIRGAFWLMPYFILPANLICITFGADYWVGANPVRRWSYCISTILSVALLLPYLTWMTSYYGTSTKLGFIATFLLPIIPVLYGIRMILKSKRTGRKPDETIETSQSMRTHMTVQKAIRIICLLSICCVLLENLHRAILTTYYHLTDYHLTNGGAILLPGFITYPISILSAILLARFVKAEFVQRNSSLDRGEQ